MSKITTTQLSAVSETLFVPLYYRAEENCRPDPMLKDPRAVEIVEKVDFDFSWLKGQEFEKTTVLMRARQFDHITGEFLAGNPRGIVVDIGCGLDTRFYRVDNGSVSWFDLDYPEVIRVREELLGSPPPRCQNIAHSALDFQWLDVLQDSRKQTHLFIAEGVFPYLSEVEIKRLVLQLKTCFPGSELLFDAIPAIFPRFSHLHPSLKGTKARAKWGMKDPHDLEKWSDGIRLLSDWHYFDQLEPRLGAYRLLRFVPPFARGFRIVHYQLGSK